MCRIKKETRDGRFPHKEAGSQRRNGGPWLFSLRAPSITWARYAPYSRPVGPVHLAAYRSDLPGIDHDASSRVRSMRWIDVVKSKGNSKRTLKIPLVASINAPGRNSNGTGCRSNTRAIPAFPRRRCLFGKSKNPTGEMNADPATNGDHPPVKFNF